MNSLEPLANSIILLGWFLVVGILFFATLISAIVALVTSDRKRSIAIDVVLWLATSVFAVSSLPSIFPAMVSNKQATDSSRFSFTRKADLIGLDMVQASNMDELKSPIKEYAKTLGWNGKEAVFKSAKKQVSEIWQKHQDDPFVTSRLAILMHESPASDKPEEATKLLSNFSRENKRTPLIRILNELYSSEQAAKYDFNDKDIIAEIQPGWFRDVVLSDFYRKTNNDLSLKELEQERNKKRENWINRYTAYVATELILLTLGLISIGLIFARWPKDKLEEIPSYGFRKVYGCILANFYTQNLTGLATGILIGLTAGFTAAMNHTEMKLPNMNAIITPIVIVAGAIASLSSFYFFVCRPAGKALLDGLRGHPLVTGAAKSALYAFLGFSAITAVAIVSRVLFMRETSSGANDAMMQLVDSFITTNFLGMLWSIFWFCVLGPFTEELLMRVLLYPWLRHRIGVIGAVLISSCVFAAIHLNFPYFLHYFVIGAVLACVYERTRNFPIIVAIHGLWNAWVVLIVATLIPN